MSSTNSRRTLGIIFTLTILPTCLPQQSVGSPFEIHLTNRVDNILTLQCRLKANSLPTPDTMFFLNKSRLENFTELQLGEDHRVSFAITRDLEGYFTCGNNSFVSNPMALIAFPDSMVYREPSPVYAILGERVQLNCVISPGQLIQQYSITWERNRTAIVSTNRNLSPALDDRYSVDPSDLSLIIDNVQLEEASDAYRCRLTVADPKTMQTHDYNTDLQLYNIQLIVLAPPSIDRSRLRDSIVAVGENTSFECSARGYPSPKITWFLNGSKVLPQDTGIEVYERISQSDPYNVTTSRLQITPAQIKHNGKVQCLATINTEIDLRNDNKTVELVVLGSFEFRVDVTQGGDVLFEVTLPTPLSKPVKLIMEYVDLDNLSRRKNVTSNVAYIAKTSFLHLERSSRVPFDRFRVSVRLTTSLVVGPSVKDITNHAKNRPTLVDPNIQLELKAKENKYIISGAVCGGVVLSALITVPPLLCCICYFCYKKKITRLVLDNPGKLLETYREQIRNESNSENYRMELIKKANELSKDIINYRNERKQSTHIISDGNQELASSNQEIEMSRRIEDDCPASGPPPPPSSNGSSESPHQPHSATGNEDEMKTSQDSKASLVDEALDAFVRDLQSITVTE